MKIKLAIIGDPIDHSESPAVHGAALGEIGMECDYAKVRVTPDTLADFLKQAVADGVTGFNVTMPLKAEIIPYLTGINEKAERFHSVNTVRVREGKLYGYNSDADGLIAALRFQGFEPRGSHFVILGAGNAAGPFAMTAAAEGARKITILNRDLPRAEELCQDIAKMAEVETAFDDFETDTIQSRLEDCDILVNATPLGMHGFDKDFDDLSFLDGLKPGALVSDMIYNPSRTKLLKAAEERNFEVMNGYGMLVAQALISDEIYTDTKIEMQTVYPKVLEKLGMTL